MAVDVKVPSVGESVQEGMIHQWKVKSGDYVKRDDVLLELETDKATVEVFAETSGVIEIVRKVGETVAVGDVVARLDTSAKAPEGSAAAAAAPAPAKKAAEPPPPPAKETKSAPPAAPTGGELSPAARRMAEEHHVDSSNIAGTGRGGRVTKEDVASHMEKGAPAKAAPTSAIGTPVVAAKPSADRKEWREPMSMLRRRIAERLVHAQSTAAILTTFNEVDMSTVMELRTKYKEGFKEKYGISLGFMGLFVKASIEALKAFPQINGWIDGNDVVHHSYYDIGVAVSSNRGLVVPVVHDADRMTLAELEQAIGHYAKKARDGKITVDDLSGGTFTVSNGGVFGSLLSTPILNPPQSAIMGMHKIEERPVVVNGQIVIRPMMYLALSYDHRIVDGKEAVQFLVKIKECIEDPTRLLLGV